MEGVHQEKIPETLEKYPEIKNHCWAHGLFALIALATLKAQVHRRDCSTLPWSGLVLGS